MKDKYIDLIEQSFDFPQDEFSVEDNELNFHDIPLMEIIKQYGTPLKITYLPKISQQINRAKRMFNVAMAKVDYKGSYNYCYCTKSSHFSFVLEEAMKNDIHLETSSAYDIHIINALYDGGIIDKDRYIICNGFKRPQYVENIAQLVNDGFSNTIPVLDNKEERARRAAAVAEEMHRSYLEGCVGRTYPVLFEQPKNGKFFGHAPNYMEVLVDGAELHNALKNVRIVDVDGEALLGEIVEQEAEA